mmetsp:Transcript_79160/g.229922  ORF Transcript_79160/g.229922 Transcript_79160/m.229922 type:complete len:218 (+) Transcript_79160:1567-2220(+)
MRAPVELVTDGVLPPVEACAPTAPRAHAAHVLVNVRPNVHVVHGRLRLRGRRRRRGCASYLHPVPARIDNLEALARHTPDAREASATVEVVADVVPLAVGARAPTTPRTHARHTHIDIRVHARVHVNICAALERQRPRVLQRVAPLQQDWRLGEAARARDANGAISGGVCAKGNGRHTKRERPRIHAPRRAAAHPTGWPSRARCKGAVRGRFGLRRL